MTGVTPREPARSGDEQDVISTRWRKMYAWTQRAGTTAKVKRAIRRRERQAGKRAARKYGDG